MLALHANHIPRSLEFVDCKFDNLSQPPPPNPFMFQYLSMRNLKAETDSKEETKTAVEIPTPKTVAEALELARDTPEGAADTKVREMLDAEMARIWACIEAEPKTYVMTRDEFAVFNYYGSKYVGNELAAEARGRYWSYGTP